MKYFSVFCCLIFMLVTLVSIVGCHDFVYGNFSGGTVSPGGATGVISGAVTASEAIAVSIRNPAMRTAVRVSSASVWLQDNFNIATSTNASGEFNLGGVPVGGNHRIIARFQLRDESGNITTYKVRSPEISVTNSTPVRSGVNLDLQLASNTVSGILHDAEGNPIPFVTLMVWGEQFHTDANGRFESPPLPPPAASETAVESITINAPGFSEDSFTTSFGPPGTIFVEATIQKVSESHKHPRIMLFRDPTEGSVAASGKTTLWAVFFDPERSAADLKPLSWDIPDGVGASSSASLPDSLRTSVDMFTAGISAEKIGIEAISWTAPFDEGHHAVSVSVRNAAGVEEKGTVRIPVANNPVVLPPLPVNRPPIPTVSGSATAQVNARVSLEAVPNDPDGNFGMTFLWSVQPADGTFSTTTAGHTVWTAPSATGTYEFACLVTDPSRASGKATHRLIVYPAATIAPPPPKQFPAPRIVSLQTVTVGRELSIKVVPNDPDGDTGLSYAWSVNPARGSFSSISSANATWTAPFATGTYELQCSVSDGQEMVTATQTVLVIPEIPVSAPHRISGFVRDLITDVPIVGAIVAIAGSDRFAITDDQGYFQFFDVPAGTYKLIATRNGYQLRTFAGVVVPEN
ncbi:MAG: carboxypeptidase regulatory-like domain-containing protein [Candidatus Riflebacteria bacterium]|nr:carboxypeptidase regulatory-like domain-containing protein [Candidatus Riflebacteria bacterium]